MNPALGRMAPLFRAPRPCRPHDRALMLWGMFIRYFVELQLSFADVEARLLMAPEAWVPGLARDAEARGERLLAEVGFWVDGERRVEKEIEIELGTPFRTCSKTLLPLTMRATGPRGLFPLLEADVEVAALGPRRTQLSINARYRPPLGAVGRALDRALLHRVAEATVKDFLDRVGDALRAGASVEGGSRFEARINR